VTRPTEALFEDTITTHLVESGVYLTCKWGTQPRWSSDFDPRLGLDTVELFAFVEATQTKEWATLVKTHGGDPATARLRFLRRLASQIDERGTVDVLRQGVRDQNTEIRLAYFKPAHGLTPALIKRYQANRLTVTRQLPYEPGSNNTLDLCLFVNGLPVATAELKNLLTGQSIDHAIKQYREDRDPNNLTLSRRALVHFAVDPNLVSMTTRLAGEATVFLPFNRGHDGGKGNPPNPEGHRTAYLWERVWARDPWMDLLARFVHVERPATGSAAARKAAERLIFPRYHQWDAVLALEAHARANGAGQSYLIQHSAGSGKSNTIAWTSHRLSSLHDDQDRKVFDKVVVITDRRVLDRQLQETVYQFEHARGVVVKIDQHSQQLAEALAGEQARIIITTLQKFPFVLDKIRDLPARRYAIVVDEAHSSQGGEAAHDLKLALGVGEEQELTVAEAEDAGLVAVPEDPVEAALAKAAAARGQQSNLSLLAFTATPKQRTLELFGTFHPETGKYEPFHLYTMRQAIEEGFILDVLANYTTYQTFFRIGKAITEDPEYDKVKARRAIGRFFQLHPHQLNQKAEIIVEHFRTHTAGKIGGQAKAMVVTRSRAHAVRYKQAIDKYTYDHRYLDIATLVAFSGRVILHGVGEFTEPKMNRLPESQTVKAFDSPDYQMMIVAEKFQTGFDQPLLHTMYVDKVLTGLAAVQTLSRLNRTHRAKSDTFVLDFENDGEEIQRAFEPYYGRTVALPTDPNQLWDARYHLDEYDVLRPDEVVAGVAEFVRLGSPQTHQMLYAWLAPAVERFYALDEENRLGFQDALNRFVRAYSFISQIVSFIEVNLERDYTYCRMLALVLKDATVTQALDLGSQLELTHLRHEITYEGSLSLAAGIGDVRSTLRDTSDKRYEPEVLPLSHIVDVLNERFGLELGESDKLLFNQFEEDWAADTELVDQARSNTLENFRLVFDPKFMDTIVGRMDSNQAIFKQILDDADFKQVLADFYLRKVYHRLRVGDQPPVG
jgi:type I restriction enzyme R subunit